MNAPIGITKERSEAVEMSTMTTRETKLETRINETPVPNNTPDYTVEWADDRPTRLVTIVDGSVMNIEDNKEHTYNRTVALSWTTNTPQGTQLSAYVQDES